MTQPDLGVWLIGARGGVAATAATGLCALQHGWIGDAGLVSRLPQFQHLDLAAWDSFVVGGHEIRGVRLTDEACGWPPRCRATARELIARCRAELERIDARIRPGTLRNVGPTIAETGRPATFRRGIAAADRRPAAGGHRRISPRNKLEHVVVVNVASTEPPVDARPLARDVGRLEAPLAEPACPLPASSLYAIAALDLGCSYINFTPSLGSAPAAIDELARLRGARHTGCDGKTGETLLKSVLAPMFARRNLQVMSWVGHNIFGNMDGRVLDDPANKQAKIASKDHILAEMLGYRPQTLVSIEFIESLGDWKTAWDHIHFAGFLGTPMTMQFIWQGCDSILAAPLVLDLVRFVELCGGAARRACCGSSPVFSRAPWALTSTASTVSSRCSKRGRSSRRLPERRRSWYNTLSSIAKTSPPNLGKSMSAVNPSGKKRPPCVEILDPMIVEVLRRKTPAERVEMIFDANRTVRLLLEGHLRWRHPDWDDQAVMQEIARRMCFGTT